MAILVLVVVVAVIVIIYALVKLAEGVKMQHEVMKETFGSSPYDAKKTDKTSKGASVVGRAVVGGVIAGPTGAVVGALSAVDKNNKSKK